MPDIKNIRIEVHYYNSVKPTVVTELSQLFEAAKDTDQMIEFIKISGTDENSNTHLMKFEFGSMQVISSQTPSQESRQKKMSKLIGHILVNTGLITLEQLQECLTCQQLTSPSKKLGEILLEKGYITEEQLKKVISEQLGV